MQSIQAKFPKELFKKKQHAVYCVLHGIESSVGKYYDTPEVHGYIYIFEILIYCLFY